MTVEFHGQPNYTRALDLLLRMEAERHGCVLTRVKIEEGKRDGLDADAGSYRGNHGKRGVYASDRMAG
jgi:hypothetical protein